jgi:undecaprenyl-diphosphatase
MIVPVSGVVVVCASIIILPSISRVRVYPFCNVRARRNDEGTLARAVYGGSMSRRAGWWLAAATAAVVFVLLGTTVAHRPPGAFDRGLEDAWFGHALGTAWIFTASGLLSAQLAIGAVLVVFGALVRGWRLRAWYTVLSMLVMHEISDGCKELFMRPRPERWAIVHETSYAYPSGHAVTAVVLYALWGAFLLCAPGARPARAAAGVLLLAWAAAICWSRIALGAHWPTDVLGGCLLGCSWVCASMGVRVRLRT